MREQLVKNPKNIYGGINRCTSITVHETANISVGADAQAHANLQSNGNVRQASWHVQVDDKEAVRSFPDTAQCWHGGTREANEGSLALEICVNADGDYEKAFTRAAGVVRDWRIKHKLSRADVKQHFTWTGKNCPTQMRLAARWEEFLDLTEPKGATLSTMTNPVLGTVSSEYSTNRKHPVSGKKMPHLGIDIAAPVGTPILAAFAGKVIGVRDDSYRGDPTTSSLNPGRTGGYVCIQNPDGERQWYGHIKNGSARVNVGDSVKQGQHLADVGDTGVVTGPHCHFEIHDAKGRTRNPRIDFDHFKIKPGVSNGDVKPAGKPSTPKPPASKPKPPAKKPAPKPTGSVVDWLSARKRDSSFAARKKLSAQYGIKNYAGTASQNLALLGKLQGGIPRGKSVAAMAAEVIAGKHGNGHSVRQKSLGIDSATYARVKAEVNRKA